MEIRDSSPQMSRFIGEGFSENSEFRPASAGSSFALLFWLLALTGCGAPGDPEPPRAKVPAGVRDLAVRQEGASVVLRFTLPTATVQGEALRVPPAVEIYRGQRQRGETKVTAALIYTIPGAFVETYVENGRVRFSDPLAPEDWKRLAGRELLYAVKTRASRRVASAFSSAVSVAVHPPPEPVGAIRAEVTEKAIELAWTPVTRTTTGENIPALAGYRVYRAEVEAAGDRAAAVPPESAKAKLKTPLELLGLTPTATYRDAQFEFGRSYIYVVRGVAQYEADEVESGDSQAAQVAAVDRFAPAAPQGLVAVVVTPDESAARPAGELKAYIELSWSISAETDLAGYHIYRKEEGAESGDRQGQRLNIDLLLAPAFRDMSVLPGRRYGYAVTAVDREGNESRPSATVFESVPRRER